MEIFISLPIFLFIYNMKLISLDNVTIKTNSSGNSNVEFTITIPNDAYIEHFYIANADTLITEANLKEDDYFQGLIDQNVYDTLKEVFNDNFEKIYQTDYYSTYTLVLNMGFLMGSKNGEVWDGTYDPKIAPLFITLKIDALTEAKQKADCSESALTFALFDTTAIMADIIRYGRYVTNDCVDCCKPSDLLIQKILEYRLLEAAVVAEDWLLVKELYQKIYSNEEGSSTIAYTIANAPHTTINKCNCNG